MAEVCVYCGLPEDHTLDERGKFIVELRPYGPGGAPVCFDCGTNPEHQAQTEAAFGALLGANEAISPVGVAMIDGSSEGPKPFDPRQVGDG